MYEKLGFCEVCGNDYTMKSPNAKYCSEKCLKKAKGLNSTAVGWKTCPMSKNMKKISAIAAEAVKQGMSYGEYVKIKGL